jgi:hypothetical protein
MQKIKLDQGAIKKKIAWSKHALLVIQIGRYLHRKCCTVNMQRIILFPAMKVYKLCQQGALVKLEAFPGQQLRVPEYNSQSMSCTCKLKQAKVVQQFETTVISK